MRKEFKLTDEQLDKLLDACKPVPYMIIAGIPPRTPQQNANSAWQQLGKELGFEWDTVRPVQGKSQHYFTAILLPKDELPRSQCCAVDMPDWPDSDLCPRCKEHRNTGV